MKEESSGARAMFIKTNISGGGAVSTTSNDHHSKTKFARNEQVII